MPESGISRRASERPSMSESETLVKVGVSRFECPTFTFIYCDTQQVPGWYPPGIYIFIVLKNKMSQVFYALANTTPSRWAVLKFPTLCPCL